MSLRNKQEECGCHLECTVLEHECDTPCEFPDCLTQEESEQLCAEIMKDYDPTD